MAIQSLQFALEELKRRKQQSVFDPTPFSFGPQLKFVQDSSQFVDALTTRRAGKSNGLCLKYFKVGHKHRGVILPYIALTRDSAKNIMWPVIQEQAEACKISVKFKESNLTAELPNGSYIKLFGADMKNFIRRMRGIKSPLIGVDEAGEFGAHLESLIDDVLTPCIADFPDGQIVLTGTPGPIPFGYFYDVTELKKFGFSHHSWSLYDNPFMPNPRDFVKKLKARKQWKDDNPTYLREWCGKWVKDLDILVFKYDPHKNNYEKLPSLTSHVIGVDLGLHDADAISVIGWNERSPQAYLVKEDIQSGQGITELANKISRYIDQYDPVSVVMDTGGLGAKIAEELRRRYNLPIKAAEKTRKFEYIEILNDAMRMGHFLARNNTKFASDCALVQWDNEKLKPDRKVISDKYHSDICDSVLYAFREALHWLHEPETPQPQPQSPAWFKQQEDQLYQDTYNRLIPQDDGFGWEEM